MRQTSRMNPTMRVMASLCGMFVAALAGQASAAPQYYPDGYGQQSRGARTLRCESTDGRVRECPLPIDGQVRLSRQLSKAACIEGRSWGNDRGRVWVTQGCRAEFVVDGGYSDAYDNSGYQVRNDDNPYGDGQLVRCDSNSGRQQHCPIDGRGDVQLARRLSDASCDEGRDWGVDREGLWVDHGCRAEFRVAASGYGGHNGQQPQVVRCESNSGRIRQCPANVRGGVRLSRQLSSTRCIEGRTWGVNRNGLWVDRGCRAEFETGAIRNNGWGWGQYRDDNRYGNDGYGHDVDGQATDSGAQLLRCESADGRTHRCAADIRGGARIARQLSRTQCTQGYSWGWDSGGIWVSGGCRAEFEVW